MIFWCRKFLSSPSYQEWFWSTKVNRKYSRYKLHEKYLNINFSVPNFINIQTVAFALHINVPCYGSRLPYWSTTPWYLVVTNMVLKLFTHFFKISFWLGTPGQCFWPGIMHKWTVCVFWVFLPQCQPHVWFDFDTWYGHELKWKAKGMKVCHVSYYWLCLCTLHIYFHPNTQWPKIS